MTTTIKELSVLLVEDDEDDYLITRALLGRARSLDCRLDWVTSYDEGRDAILQDEHDAYLVDFRLGPRNGLDLLEEVTDAGGVTGPIILLTGQGDLEVDLQAMEAGAADYLSKDNIDAPLLERSLRYAVERKDAERRIREQAQLLDKARDAILAFDMDGQIVYWNKGAERLTGWSKEEILGEWAHECLYDPDQEDKLRQCHETMMEQGEWTGELRMRTAEGDERIVESRWSLVRDADGTPKQALVINTDVTERKRLESQFLRSQRMESIGRLVGGIAHDLGNLLMPITLGVKVLRRRIEQSDEKIDRTLSMIQKSAERGGNMVEQVLAFARGVEGERVALRIGAIVEEIQDITDETFPENIEVKTAVDDVPQVMGDATQIQQVLMNLCVNARDAMPDGGTLSIDVAPVEFNEADAQRNIDATPGSYVCISVQDTGSGMSADVADKIFEPFFTTKEAGDGTGLGLSTAYSILQSHGGFIEVTSEEGVGTTFRVYLPVSTEQQDRRATRDEGSGVTQGDGERVLVVDDEQFILETTREALRDAGYRVLTAEGGEEALQQLERHEGDVDLMLTDLRMPQMDGLELIRSARSHYPHLSILAASGMADGRSENAVNAGADSFLAKPFSEEELQRSLQDVMRARDGAAA